MGQCVVGTVQHSVGAVACLCQRDVANAVVVVSVCGFESDRHCDKLHKLFWCACCGERDCIIGRGRGCDFDYLKK